MFENEILKPGEKIKRIRKEYRISQNDLAGNDVSRQFISRIENGQSDLTEEVAKFIENNLREVFKKIGIEYPNVTAAQLMETEDEQIQKILDKYNEDLVFANSTNITSSFANIQEEIKKIYDKYSDTIKNIKFLGIIKILCETTLRLSKWEEAKIYVMKGIDMSNSYNLYNELLVYYNWITAVSIGLREYKGIIPVYIHALELYEKHDLKDIETFTKITINAAIACRKSNMNNECIEYLSKVEFTTKDTSNLFKINNLLGKSFTILKQYDQAEIKLLKALEYAKSTSSSNNVNDLSIVLENLCILYLETNRGYDAIKYIDRMEQIIDSITNDYQRARNMYYLTIIEIIRDSKGKVKSLFCKVSNLAAKLKDNLMLYKISYEVCKYLIYIDDVVGLEQLADNIYKTSIESSVIHERIPNVILVIAEYFEESNLNETIRKKISKYAYRLERQICREESFEI